jgi:hypothetical protein
VYRVNETTRLQRPECRLEMRLFRPPLRMPKARQQRRAIENDGGIRGED